MKLQLIVLFSFLAFYGFNQIPIERQKQLDSIVSSLDRSVLKNLDSIHYRLNKAGRNDEEKVFLYFGLIAIHYKYDYERKGDRNAKEYSPYYIVFKKKAVCRDFALIFEELCKRSNISCAIATGRVSVPPQKAIIELFKRRIKRESHAWNVVKYNDEWHPVDPTWSKIDSVRKYYTYDELGHRKYMGKTNISNREYYEKSPRDFYRKRKCFHPAFYCMDTVYTYRTSKRKYKNRKIYATNYDYKSILDSMSMNSDFLLSSAYQEGIKSYADLNYIYTTLWRDFKFAEIKHTEFAPITPLGCDEHLVELERKLNIVQKELGSNFDLLFNAHKEEVLKLKKKLVKKENALTKK